jgi:hypothetical protein
MPAASGSPSSIAVAATSTWRTSAARGVRSSGDSASSCSVAVRQSLAAKQSWPAAPRGGWQRAHPPVQLPSTGRGPVKRRPHRTKARMSARHLACPPSWTPARACPRQPSPPPPSAAGCSRLQPRKQRRPGEQCGGQCRSAELRLREPPGVRVPGRPAGRRGSCWSEYSRMLGALAWIAVMVTQVPQGIPWRSSRPAASRR